MVGYTAMFSVIFTQFLFVFLDEEVLSNWGLLFKVKNSLKLFPLLEKGRKKKQW